MAAGPELQPALDLLARAFPSGLSESDYKPLLAALTDGFSERQLADLVAAFTGRDRAAVDNDHAAVRSHDQQDPVAIGRVRQRLVLAGYDDLPD